MRVSLLRSSDVGLEDLCEILHIHDGLLALLSCEAVFLCQLPEDLGGTLSASKYNSIRVIGAMEWGVTYPPHLTLEGLVIVHSPKFHTSHSLADLTEVLVVCPKAVFRPDAAQPSPILPSALAKHPFEEGLDRTGRYILHRLVGDLSSIFAVPLYSQIEDVNIGVTEERA